MRLDRLTQTHLVSDQQVAVEEVEKAQQGLEPIRTRVRIRRFHAVDEIRKPTAEAYVCQESAEISGAAEFAFNQQVDGVIVR